MFMDPGECYSKCETEVVGMQETTCHCNPKPSEEKTHVTGCYSTCSNPNGTACGAGEAVSIYRKVQYRESGGPAPTEIENCRVFYWEKDGQPFYTWKNCLTKYPYLCSNDVTSSTEFEYYATWKTWGDAAGRCLQNNKNPAVELSSGYPDVTPARSINIWVGQIRSRVIAKYAASSSESTTQTRVSSTTTSWEYRNSSEKKAKPNGRLQFPMIAVYAGVPAVLIIVAVVVIVILRIRRKHTDDVKDDPALCHDNYENNTISRNAVSKDSYQDCDVGHTYFILEPVSKNAVLNDADINAGNDNEYDTTANLQSKVDVKSNGTGNAYNTLEDIANDTYDHTNSHTVTIANDTYDKVTNDEHG